MSDTNNSEHDIDYDELSETFVPDDVNIEMLDIAGEEVEPSDNNASVTYDNKKCNSLMVSVIDVLQTKASKSQKNKRQQFLKSLLLFLKCDVAYTFIRENGDQFRELFYLLESHIGRCSDVGELSTLLQNLTVLVFHISSEPNFVWYGSDCEKLLELFWDKFYKSYLLPVAKNESVFPNLVKATMDFFSTLFFQSYHVFFMKGETPHQLMDYINVLMKIGFCSVPKGDGKLKDVSSDVKSIREDALKHYAWMFSRVIPDHERTHQLNEEDNWKGLLSLLDCWNRNYLQMRVLKILCLYTEYARSMANIQDYPLCKQSVITGNSKGLVVTKTFLNQKQHFKENLGRMNDHMLIHKDYRKAFKECAKYLLDVGLSPGEASQPSPISYALNLTHEKLTLESWKQQVLFLSLKSVLQDGLKSHLHRETFVRDCFDEELGPLHVDIDGADEATSHKLDDKRTRLLQHKQNDKHIYMERNHRRKIQNERQFNYGDDD